MEKEALEKDSYFENVEATSFAKDTQELEKELHMSKIKELTYQLEINKILENHLKKENKACKKNNAKLVRENEKLNEEVGKLKRKNNILCKHEFKWLKDKNMWKNKYEKQKVKVTIYKEEHSMGIDYMLEAAQQAASGSGTRFTIEVRRSKRKKQA